MSVILFTMSCVQTVSCQLFLCIVFNSSVSVNHVNKDCSNHRLLYVYCRIFAEADLMPG